MIELALATGTEVAEAFDGDRWGVLPVGSIEYHGPMVR